MLDMFDRLRRRRKGAAPQAPPLTAHQLWMVSLCAPVNRGSEAASGTLYPFRYSDDSRAERWLREQWEIADRPELLSRLEGLLAEGFRRSLPGRLRHQALAWDLALYADVVRKGYAAGHLDEVTAWHLLRGTIAPATARYTSWTEFADDYLLVRMVWRENLQGTPDEDFPAPQAVSDAHLRTLLDPANRASPWNHAPWHVISGPDHAY